MNYALELKDISKSFGGVTALNGVDFQLKAGEVHAIVGENGAGKSTLIKIAAGAHRPDRGEILLNGQAHHFKNPIEAIRAGISVIYQETSLFPDLTILENIFTGRLLTHKPIPFVNYKLMSENASRILKNMDIQIDVNSFPHQLGIAEKQMVEIAKALSLNAKIVIMDEPTAALSHKEVDALFSIIESLKSKGVSIIYISHRLDEVYSIADRVTVLRDGAHIATFPVTEKKHDELVGLMVGRKIDTLYHKDQANIGEPALEVEHLCQQGVIDDISFVLRKGQILGFAGLAGAGRTELAMLIAGFTKKGSGSIKVFGKESAINTYKIALSRGITYISEDRQKIGLIMDMSIKDNITLPLLRLLSAAGVINKKRERQIADEYIRKLSIKAPNWNFVVKNLSGGNQQKVSVAKGLASEPKILILDEPTRGVDVGAKYEIHSIINELAKQGMAIMLISSDLPELLGMSDALIVMNKGRKVAELRKSEASQEKVLSYAIGIHEEGSAK